MPNKLASLTAIKAVIEKLPHELTLNGKILAEDGQVLGEECLGFLRALFGRQASFCLTNCTIVEGAEYHLIFKGTFKQLLSWANTSAEMALLDVPTPNGARQRHCVFRIDGIREDNFYLFSDHLLRSTGSHTVSEGALTRSLQDYAGKISFSERTVVCSSVDYSALTPAIKSCLDKQIKLDAAFQVKAGVNFLIDFVLDTDLERYLAQIAGQVDNTGKSQGLIYPGDGGLYLMLRKGIVGGRLGGDVGMELQGVGIVLPAVPKGRPNPEIVFDGTVRIGTESLGIKARFNVYYETLAVSCFNFPSLKEIVELIEKGIRDTDIGEPFSGLLSVRLSMLGMVFSLRDKSVSEISCSLTAQEDIKLIEKIISFKPALNMRIEAPFDNELRSIEGTLEGTWKLGNTAFKTALYYPSFDFSAGIAEGETVDAGAVLKQILAGIDLAAPHLGFTKMEVHGNFLSKSFSAEIDVDDNSKCAFSIAGRSFEFQIKNMLMAYDNQRISCAMNGSLDLAGLKVLLSAQYETDQGWRLSGSTPVGEKINVSRIAHDLLETIALPTDSRGEQIDLELTDIVFSAAPKLGEYSLSGRTAGAWELADELHLTVEQFVAAKSQGLSVTGLLRVNLDIGGTVVLLSAEKAAAAAGGWKFQGSSAEGQEIKIDKIVEWVGKKFAGEPQLPEAIKGFKVNKLKLSFESERKDFFFTCEGEVSLSGKPVQGTVTIDIKHQGKDKSDYTKLFGGSLIIDGMEFDLVFESSHKGSDGDSSTLFAAYRDDKGHKVKIDDIINRILSTPATTGLDIGIKDALFAYQKKKDTPAKYLFGLDIEGGLNLSALNLPDLPLIGQPLPSGENLKLALQVLATNDTFTAEEISGLNKLNAEGLSLPQQELKQGLKLAALLRVGQETKPLSLPIGLGKGDGQGTGLVHEPPPPVSATTTTQPALYPSSEDGTQWINIQKTLGPIHVERVGVGYQTGGNIALLLDAALTAAGLTLSLDGLGAEFALKDLANKTFKPTFHLDGLGIDYRSGPVEIGGSFLRQKMKLGREVEYTGYAGLAVIRTQKLTLSAIGSYAQINERDPSLFIYAVANYPLGGPAFFYVTGFAAGFGYNRALTLPPIDEIASFPLVAEAVKDGGPASLPSSQKEQKETLTNKLQQLEKYVPPSVGDIFIAAGIKFTSFKQIDSFALLVVKFGRRFEIDLLGLSTLTAPPPQAAKSGQKAVAPIAEAQLVLRASFIPDEGFLGVRAQLTPNSYILSKDCHLNGGFAFYTWFEPHPHAGDFVLTLGGYHPKFIVPDHYPQVPRLALNWQVSPELHIKADAYFALTGSAIMAGGHLQATWESGDLRAWFVAGADFLLAWKPFHYDLELYVGMGVSYTFKAIGNQTLNVDLGANLHLWGPEFSGTATIHWSIISFTVNFGEGAAQHLEKLDWDTFKTSFLPKPEKICSIAVQQGLTRQMKVEESKEGQSEKVKFERWIVNPNEMVLAIHSAIPLNRMESLPALAGGDLTIAPMGIESDLISSCSITITRDDKQSVGQDTFQLEPIRKPMPAGLWGKPNLTKDKKYLEPPNLNGRQSENLLTGFEVRPTKKGQKAHSCHIKRRELKYDTELIPEAYRWQDLQLSGSRGRLAWNKAAETVIDTQQARDQLIRALGLVDTKIDFGEPVNQGVLSAA